VTPPSISADVVKPLLRPYSKVVPILVICAIAFALKPRQGQDIRSVAAAHQADARQLGEELVKAWA